MATILNASNSGAGGLVQSADASGVLVLQGGGNTQVTINSTSMSVRSLNLKVNVQKFTSSGTYTPTANIVYAIIECVGGGGQGGMAYSYDTTSYGGAGGGGGGYARKYVTASDIGSSQTVTIGAGGTGTQGWASPGTSGSNTSVGTLCKAGGGGGGPAATEGYGGGPGVGITGDVLITGTPGTPPAYGTYQTATLGGTGGSSVLGGGGRGYASSTSGGHGSGYNGEGYGGGGSGGFSYNLGGVYNGAVWMGAAGANGAVVITEFYLG